MADHPRFGPAGVPLVFRLMKATLSDVPRLLREEGLDAFEYQAVRWGAKPQIKIEYARELGLKARESDVWLSVHGTYFTNLSGQRSIIQASIKRLIACITAAEWMGARVVVFHPGYYGRKPKELALKNCKEALREAAAEMTALSIKNVRIGLETMGKPSQLGSLNEIISLCEDVERVQPVIDWSHVHARSMGRLRKVDDFRKVVETIEKRLGTEAAKNLHCHFTKVEFTDKGERRHHTLSEKRYGPDFAMLAEVIAEFDLKPVIISESPLLDVDAMKMRDMLQKEMSD